MRLILRLFLLLLAWGALGRTDALAQTTCTGAAVTTLDYSTVTPTGDRKNATDVATSVSVTTNAYTTATAAGQTNTFAVGADGALAGTGNYLVWKQNYQGVNPGTTANRTTVTYTFSRPVNSLKITITDIDRDLTNNANFIDRLTFDGYATTAATTPITLTTTNVATGNTNAFVGSGSTATGTTTPAAKSNAVTGTATSTANRASDVTVTFPSAVTRLVLTYENLAPYTANTDRTQTSGIASLSWCRNAPTANNVTTATMPSSAGQVGISPLDAASEGTITSYKILTLPDAGQGILYYNSTGTTYAAATTNLTLTPAQAASLRFDPADGSSGNASFTYSAADDGGLTTNTATYTLPINNTTCSTTGSLAYTSRPAGEDWKTHAALAVPAGSTVTTVSTSSYTVPASATNNTFITAVQNGVQTLQWRTDYANTTNNSSSVTFTFNRPVSNFAMQVQDIDKLEDGNANSFIDRVAFTGANGGAAVTPVLGPVNSNGNSLIISGNTATGTVNNTSAVDASVIAYFPAPVTSITVTYSNVSVSQTNPSQNAIGIDLLSFCRLAPVANAITTDSRPSGQGAAPITSLSTASIDGTTQSYTISALPPAAQGIYYVNGVVLNTTNFPGLVLTPTQATQLSFAPAAAFSGNAGFTYIVTDDAGTPSTAVTYTIPVTPTGAAGTAAPCATPGKDGSPTLTTNPNTYFPSTATQTLATGATAIAVGTATGANTNIAAGDLLLVIQMQGADIDATNTDSYGDGVAGGGANGNLTSNFTAGTYEYVVANSAVTAGAGGTITLASALKNSYTNAAATATTGQRRFQVVRVPQYSTLTLGGNIAATPWNGTSGGIVVLDVAGQLNLGGFTIDASGAGFRGGAGRQLAGSNAAGLAGTDYRTAANLAVNGQKGEGTAGTPQYVNNGGALLNTGADGYPNGSNGRGAPGNAGGGGTDTSPTNNSQNDGGGGGANGGAGGRGGNAWSSNAASGGEPGAAFNVASSSRLVLGGGGGAGVTNDGTGTPNAGFASSGAAGGGLVIIRTGTVSGTGSILANGAAANNTVLNDGSGGGGAGGSILVTAANPASLASANVTLAAVGGTGGTNTGGGVAHGPGGGGGGGVVLTNGSTASVLATAGANGTTFGNVAFGAAPGLTGTTNTQISNSIANSAAGSGCIADVATTLTGPATANAGSTVALTAVFSNNGPLAATGVARVVTLPGSAALTLAGISAPGGTVTGDATNGYTVTYPTLATLAANASNSFTISYTAPAAGTIAATSTITPAASSTEGGLTANNTATVSTAINQIADVTTTLTGPATLSTDQLSGNYTATFTNNGPSTATSVTQKVTLPAGVTNVVLPAGATLTGSTIDFGTASTLNTTASNSFVFSFTAPGTPSTPGTIALTSNVTTTSNQGANAAADQSTLNLTVNKNTPPTSCAPSYFDGTNSYSGLSAEYYSGYYNGDPTYFNGKTPNLKRVDPNLNYGSAASFGDLTTSGASTANNTIFSARYRGSLSITTAGSYTFYVGSDDASNIWLDGAALAPTAATSLANANYNAPKQFTLNLSSGLHNLTVYYGNGGGAANLTLEYSSTAGAGFARQIIPNSVLCAGMSNVPPIALNGMNANIPSNAGPTTLSPSLNVTNGTATGTDQDGTVTSFVLATLPTAAQGVLRLSNGTAVVIGQTYTVAQTAGFTFQPVSSFTGPASFTFSAIDNTGQLSNDVATYTIPVTASADVTTTLAGPAVLNAGQPSGTFTATFTNNGPNTASGVTQTVTIPAGAANVLVNGVAYTPTGNVIDFGTATTLANGATNTFTYSFTAPTTAGTVMQTSNVGTTGSSQGADTAPNSATLTSTVNPVADVATTIIPSATSVPAGQTASFAVTFKNNGPSDASAVTATVQLAAGLSGVTITGYGAGTATYNSTTGVVTYPSATYTNGTTNNSTIAFTMPANGSLTGTSTINTTTNEAGLTANDVASATINGTPVFDLTTKISGPATTVAGTLTTYSVLTINNGPSSASNVGQTAQLPMNLTNVFVSNGGTYDATSGVVTFPTLSGLPSGAVVNNTISFMAPSAAFPVSAIVSGDVNTANNTAYLNGNASSTNVTVTPASTTNANLYTTITTLSANVQPGAAVTFTVVAGNNGPNAATGVVERVELPSGLTGVTVSNGGTYDATTGLVTFPTVASLVSGTANTYTITANAPASGVVAATASVSATTNDPMMADNVATTDVTVSGVSDVATTISGPTKANAGQSVTYAVTTTNNGLAPAANVVQTVNIPAGLTSVTISGGGSYDINTGIVTFPAIAGQVSGNSVQNTITYNAPAIASTMIIASVTSSSPDNVKTNNRAAITTTTDAIADVTVSLTGPATIVQGNQVDYLVVTTNNGPSSATNVATRVQLPAGLGTITLSAGGAYDNTTGIVTFSTLGTERTGQPGTVTNVIRFIAPAGLSQINATASVSTDTEESSYANNTSSIITTETAPTATQTDLSTTITSTPATLTAGQSASLSVTTKNGGPGAATGVVQRVALEAGLTISSITNGGTYDAVTGIVTFPAISLASGTTTTNTIVLVAPGTNPLQVRALVTGNESDPTSSNNSDFKPLTINSVVDVATTVSGPTAVAVGDAVTYSVLTLNNGPSAASNVVQKVTIPASLTGVVVSNGGTYDSGTGIVTFPTITSQNGDASSQVMNTISFTAPSTSFTVVGNVTTASTEPNTTATMANNTAMVTVGPINTAPVANAVVNMLQTPQGNTAGPLLLSPLSATDADGSVVSYTIASIPNATTQGVLTLNGTAVKVNDVILIADASKLRFDPVAAFVGNAFFTYTAKDNLNAVSAVAATYTIPVGQDNASVFVNTPVKGSGNAYANGDVISNGFDVNGGSYNSAAAVTDNGIRSATTDAAGTTTLANLGVSLNSTTGQFTVTDRTKLTQGTYSVSITTTDVDGGVTTQTVTFTIGANPLPVVLTAFTAQAVQNRDALLNWATASEQNSVSFEVERSLDGNTFTKIGQVAAQGTSATATAYTFTDAGIGARTQGSVYYRLRQLDLSGAAYYSLVRTVGFTKAVTVALSVYPNPATTSTVLDLSMLPASASYQVVVLDAIGRQVLTTTQAGGLSQPLDLTSLASGTYNVLVTGKLANGTALRQVLRLIKE